MLGSCEQKRSFMLKKFHLAIKYFHSVFARELNLIRESRAEKKLKSVWNEKFRIFLSYELFHFKVENSLNDKRDDCWTRMQTIFSIN